MKKGFEQQNIRPEIQEQEKQEYNFEEIAEIEPAVVELLKQMKEKFEKGEWDTFISDDVGGRIPTLILRKIYKKLNPNIELNTYFIAAGNYLPDPERDKEKYAKLQEYLGDIAKSTENALIITQYTHSGNSIANLSKALEEAGIKNHYMATLERNTWAEHDRIFDLGVYSPKNTGHKIAESHEHLGGVRKSKKEYSPHPKKAIDVLRSEGREVSYEEWEDIFGLKGFEYYTDAGKSYTALTREEREERLDDPERKAELERRENAPLTPEEEKEIQENINKAREDVDVLAERVIEQVWPDLKNL